MSTRIVTLLTAATAALTFAGGATAAHASPTAPPPADDASPAAASPLQEGAPQQQAQPQDPGPYGDQQYGYTPYGDQHYGNTQHGDYHPSYPGDVRRCYDARCTIEIRDGMRIPFHPRFGLAPLEIGVDGRRVTFTFRSLDRSSSTTTVNAASPHTSATYNGITLRPRLMRDGRVVLNISRR